MSGAPHVPDAAAAVPEEQPRGDLAVRMLAMPADTNPAGDIFGGWIMSMMDVAGGIAARTFAEGRVVTVSVTDMAFLKPVHVGDVVCGHAEMVRVGTTSVTFHVEVWALRGGHPPRMKVTSAEFKYVALDEGGRPQPIRRRG